VAAAQGLGLADCGYYCLDALRIEAGRRALGAELGPDVDPYEAGLGFAVRPGKRRPFVGQESLNARSAQALRRSVLTFRCAAMEPWVWGGEPLLRDGVPVGELSSVGCSGEAGCMVGLGLVDLPEGCSPADAAAGHWEIDVAGERRDATASVRPAWTAASN
jgi:glycine cleavage system aminomethyltransferase T